MINIYFRKRKIGYKYIPGDRYIIRAMKAFFGIKPVTGIEKVFLNLCKGFDELDISYRVNFPYHLIAPADAVIMLGDEEYNKTGLLENYHQPNQIIAGIGLMTHPSEWPNLIADYPIARYLQHCTWANNLFINYYGVEKCIEWPAGIDTEKWVPSENEVKNIDILVYNKIRWDHKNQYDSLRNPILGRLKELGLTYKEVVYGSYNERDYQKLLKHSKAMLFLCEHETQGFACCEAMSMNLPIFAWDPGYCMDPNRFIWNDPIFATSSVPFFDDRCGLTFADYSGFHDKFNLFWEGIMTQKYKPRDYILENLTLKKSAEMMIEIIKDVYPDIKV